MANTCCFQLLKCETLIWDQSPWLNTGDDIYIMVAWFAFGLVKRRRKRTALKRTSRKSAEDKYYSLWGSFWSFPACRIMQKGGTRFNISSRESHANNKTVSIAAYCSNHLSYVLNGAKMQNLAERNCQNNFYVCSWFVERLQNFLRQCTLFMSTFTALHALYGNIWSFLFFFFISCNFNNHYICKIATKKKRTMFSVDLWRETASLRALFLKSYSHLVFSWQFKLASLF